MICCVALDLNCCSGPSLAAASTGLDDTTKESGRFRGGRFAGHGFRRSGDDAFAIAVHTDAGGQLWLRKKHRSEMQSFGCQRGAQHPRLAVAAVNAVAA